MTFISNAGIKTWWDFYQQTDEHDQMYLTNANFSKIMKGPSYMTANPVIENHTQFPDMGVAVGYNDGQTGEVKVAIYHHLFKNAAGGFHFDKQNNKVFAVRGLTGGTKIYQLDPNIFASEVDPAKRIITPSLKSFKDAVGNEEAIIALVAVTAVNETNPADGDGNPHPTFHPRYAISMPPFLVSAFDSDEPMTILATMLTKITAYAADYLDADTTIVLWQRCFPVLQGIWILSETNFPTHSDGAMIQVHPMVLQQETLLGEPLVNDVEAIGEGKLLDLRYLEAVTSNQGTAGSLTPAGGHTATTTMGNMDPQLRTLIFQTADAVANSVQIMGNLAHSSESKGEKTKWNKRFNDDVKRFILFVSATSTTEHPVEPTASYKQLLDDSKTNAMGNASQGIINLMNGSQLVDLAKGQMFYNCAWINDSFGTYPKGFSIFFAVPAPVIGGTNMMSGDEIELRAETHNLSDAQLIKAMSQKVRVPKDEHGFMETLKNFTKEIVYTCGKDSFCFLKFDGLYDDLSKVERLLAIMAATHHDFIASLMARIDIRFQSFLRSCAQATTLDKVDFSVLDFSDELSRLKLQERLSVTLPVSVAQIVASQHAPKPAPGGGSPNKRKGKDGDDDDGDGGVVPKRPNAREQVKSAKNTSPVDPSWIIKDENYGLVFTKHIGTAPKCKGKQICVKFHAKGFCSFGDGCKRKDTHNDKFDDKAKREFGDWLKMCHKQD